MKLPVPFGLWTHGRLLSECAHQLLSVIVCDSGRYVFNRGLNCSVPGFYRVGELKPRGDHLTPQMSVRTGALELILGELFDHALQIRFRGGCWIAMLLGLTPCARESTARCLILVLHLN